MHIEKHDHTIMLLIINLLSKGLKIYIEYVNKTMILFDVFKKNYDFQSEKDYKSKNVLKP
jgi:hypothetical protein